MIVDQARRGGEVVIGAHLRRAVGIVRVLGTAAQRPVVVGRGLVHPLDRAALHVERDDGVARLLRRVGVVVAGGDVDHAALGIDRRRRPDPAAGRSPLLNAVLVLAARLGLVDRVGLPQHLARVRVEGRDAAAERAAFVLRPCRPGLPRSVPAPARTRVRRSRSARRSSPPTGARQPCEPRSAGRCCASTAYAFARASPKNTACPARPAFL